MESVINKFPWLKAFRTPVLKERDFSQFEAQTLELNARLDRMTDHILNGEDRWFLCLTKEPRVCKNDDDETTDTAFTK